MTRYYNTQGEPIVSLSLKNWIALIALILTASGLAAGAFLRHDRMLTEVVTEVRSYKEATEKRLLNLESGREPHRIGTGSQ